MTATSVETRLYRDISLWTPITDWIGTNPVRLYEPPIRQNSVLPAITMQLVSGGADYSTTQRMRQGDSRYSFVIWGGQYAAGVAARDALATELAAFFDQWSGGIGIEGLKLYPNRLVLNRFAVYQWTDTPIYQKIMDFMITSDETL